MADRARSAMMMPKIQAFVATFPASLKPRTQGEMKSHAPSTKLATSCQRAFLAMSRFAIVNPPPLADRKNAELEGEVAGQGCDRFVTRAPNIAYCSDLFRLAFTPPAKKRGVKWPNHHQVRGRPLAASCTNSSMASSRAVPEGAAARSRAAV